MSIDSGPIQPGGKWQQTSQSRITAEKKYSTVDSEVYLTVDSDVYLTVDSDVHLTVDSDVCLTVDSDVYLTVYSVQCTGKV